MADVLICKVLEFSEKLSKVGTHPIGTQTIKGFNVIGKVTLMPLQRIIKKQNYHHQVI